MLKLTFNKPARLAYLQDDHGVLAKGLQVRFGPNHNIEFRGVDTNKGKDIVSLTYRERGGAEAIFDGRLTPEVVAALRHPFQNPFYTLTMTPDNWFKPIAHKDSKTHKSLKPSEPPRTVPHVRVWTGDIHRGMSPLLAQQIPKTSDIIASIYAANRIVRDYETEGSIGRPPKRVIEARETLGEFEIAARELIPVYASALQMCKTLATMLGFKMIPIEKAEDAIPIVPRVTETSPVVTPIAQTPVEEPKPILKTVSEPLLIDDDDELPEGEDEYIEPPKARKVARR